MSPVQDLTPKQSRIAAPAHRPQVGPTCTPHAGDAMAARTAAVLERYRATRAGR